MIIVFFFNSKVREKRDIISWTYNFFKKNFKNNNLGEIVSRRNDFLKKKKKLSQIVSSEDYFLLKKVHFLFLISFVINDIFFNNIIIMNIYYKIN